MMKIRFSRFRTFVLTLTFGFAAVCIGNRLSDYFNEVPVDVPMVESETPIMIRLCPEWESGKEYFDEGQIYFSKEKAMNCTSGGGGG